MPTTMMTTDIQIDYFSLNVDIVVSNMKICCAANADDIRSCAIGTVNVENRAKKFDVHKS